MSRIAARAEEHGEASESALSKPTETANRVKSVLAGKALTLNKVSQYSKHVYGHASPYLIPHNLYHSLHRSDSFGPSLLQLCSLSRITGYRLNDWLTVFGFNLDRIMRLQVLLPTKRTMLLDVSMERADAWVPWFRDASGIAVTPGIVPLGQLLNRAESERLGALTAINNNGSLYAKIGSEDALAYPDLLPGSIVRVRSFPSNVHAFSRDGLYLVEHSKGLWCSRLHFVAKDRIHPVSNELSYPGVDLQVPSEARIVGMVDMELRWLLRSVHPEVPRERAAQWAKKVLSQRGRGLGNFLRRARRRASLSFREASALSRWVSDFLGDERHFAAPGSLSDYETQDVPPRQMHKVITLCLIYAIPFLDFVSNAGMNLEQLGHEPIPPLLIPHPSRAEQPRDVNFPQAEGSIHNPTLSALMAQFGEIPWFLRGTLADLSGVRNLSLRNFFWFGADGGNRYPTVRDVLLAVVNPQRKRPVWLRSLPLRQQPAYILRMRDGEYLCACCSLENDMLVLYPHSQPQKHPARLQNHRDAEIVGQIVAIAREFSQPL